ncbi:kinesin-like protein KIN-14T [Ricinus communis]|uniref:Kinesin, putative n=1 Tax=Ricinus communis TaxID=3988 RepID=B9SBL6_RICCO|nr:kinesin-like protein KIN-14T [Ricinus communis]XP_048235590.1 kinesin-like protein KIN-14T [Ricinus communis]XP_048235591.1 kinesin-like protein KIN-14T [Ricinus communis]EEF38964.1 kinesin, putative [Ricinus communis]|eukprot:XP_002523385.1 kinesin-like protein KIN-14T [Ricinus communis]
MGSRKSVRNLGETLESLLGLKAHLTPNWVKSVCDILKTLPSNLTDAKEEDDDNDSCNTISKIKDELAALTTSINQLNIQRRQALNDFLYLKGNIRVFCRIRPITLGENFGRVVAVNSSDVLLKLADNKSKSYTFDRVFHPGAVQDEVFSEVEPVIKSVLDGYNACIFAYGQTGTGKTFTMEGTPDEPGVVPRTFEALFKQAVESNHSFLINFSMLEIYMGNLKDLLLPKPTRPTDPISACLSVQTDPEGGIEIDNLVSIQVNDFHQALRLYRLGCRFRSTASTNSNITSSRSHCMIRIVITCFDAPERRRKKNKIWLVDLGGSERVLKTKAWGKRLDEGKAINLSLSALGDVINALQRKKRHIPYRNSKLTQVLKDSLGDDSKTLMLVHVSPKEEDLCETICSLNLATRAKNIHLGNEDIIEVREQKKVAMENLQEKMIEIEHERLHARREIEKLEKKLEKLTGKSLAYEEQLEAHSIAEEPLTKNSAADTAVAPISKLPRFMRATICSQRKSGTIFQASDSNIPVPERRRPSSHRAESVTFPVKDHSDFKSDHSVTRASCLVGLDTRNNADNATEYSQETSEIDVKMTDLREQEKASRSSASQMGDISHIQKNTIRRTGQTTHNKFLKVDNWLDLQKNGINMSGYTHRMKRVLAVPTPEKKHGRNEQRKTKKSFNEEANILYDFRTQKVVSQNKKDKLVTDGGVGRATSTLEVDKPSVTMLKDLFNGESKSNSIPVSQTTEGKRMKQAQESLDILWTEDDKWSICSLEDLNCHRLCEYKDDRANALSSMETVEDKQISDSSQSKTNHGNCEVLQSDSDGSIHYMKGDSGDSVSMSELELCCQKLPMESNTEDSERNDSEVSIQCLAKERRHDILQLRAQKALFMNFSNRKDLMKQIDKSQEKMQTRGICHVLKQKIETLCVSALLGLGFYSLGYEHEFFYSLML